MISKSLLAFVCLFAFSASELVKFEPCSPFSQETCEITNVKIDPCAEAAKDEPCKIKRGKTAGITFDFKPTWEKGAGDLKTRAYWVSVLDVPFLGMDTDGCKVTTCPIKKGEVNHYNYTLDISPTFPAQKYSVKFKVWEDNADGHDCCFIFKMRLV